MEQNHKAYSSNPVVLFDGVCNLCNTTVQLILRNDPKEQFLFGQLQSAEAQAMLAKHNMTKELVSIVLVEGDKVTDKSTAALKIAKRLKGLYPLLYGLIIIPKPLRDAVYNWVAKNRYKWFGKKDVCPMITPDLQKRFINK